MPRYFKIGLIALLAAAALGAGAFATYSWVTYLPKRFGVVDEGQLKLYRSGDVTPAQLERLHAKYGIGRVICLLNPADPGARDAILAEHATAERLGMQWIDLPMHGDGTSTPEARAKLVALYRVKDAPPTLVHCSAGVYRAGLAVGLYRIHFQGWTYDQVHAELLQHGFEDTPKHENMRAALRAATTQATATTRPA